MLRTAVLILSFACFVVVSFSQAGDLDLPPGITDSQNPSDVPLRPEEAVKRITVPDGFNVSLFAGEPHVRQPIAFAIDDRGRLWVAECYAYRTWKPEGNDRIVILEDTDNDGLFDKRKVFWDKGNYLTGLQLGFGGVYICCSPNVSFIPDRDGDDVPDGEPIVLLDGWSTKGVHNVVNGLTWGPDGWLYGCNGITSPSKVGKPGTPDDERIDINCGIWRYHPTRHAFEVLAHGTTNPWGLDFDDHGQAFFTNCVIDHLWHMVPGAHYQRMFGQDYNLHTYELMSTCSDHRHWVGEKWTDTRGGKPEQLAVGGGHAHCGAMVYLGDNWPNKYRGALLTCNTHGGRVNMDFLKRSKSGYVGQHGSDFFLANDPWFRGVELKYGPDGGVFITDWTDLGECHDTDGVHRSSGRIYKVTYGKTSLPEGFDFSKSSDDELVAAHLHKNEWHVRHARRLLQERAAAGTLSASVAVSLGRLFREQDDVTRKLRVLWTLHAIGKAGDKILIETLQEPNEHLRVWAIRLLCERKNADSSLLAKLAGLAKSDSSGLVRLELASTLQRLPLEKRWGIAEGLLSHKDLSEDRNLALMVWYGIEKAVAKDRNRAIALASKSQVPLVRQFIIRRVATK